jgi:hypothetical protein
MANNSEMVDIDSQPSFSSSTTNLSHNSSESALDPPVNTTNDQNYYYDNGPQGVSADDMSDLLPPPEAYEDDDNESAESVSGASVAAMDEFETLMNNPIPVSTEQIEAIDAIPTAADTQRGVLSLTNLCVAKILSMKMAQQEELELVDIDGNVIGSGVENINALKAKIEMFTNPMFEIDLDNVGACYEVVTHYFESYFPQTWREITVLNNLGVIVALATIDNPAAQLAARNFLTNFLERQPPSPHRTYFGYYVTFENLPHMAVSLCCSINNISNDLLKLFGEILHSMQNRNEVLHNHVRAFMKKYMPEAHFADDFRQSGWMVEV